MKFDLQQAMRNLDIEVKPFGYSGKLEVPSPSEDEARGYSCDRWLAINPGERWPVFVTFHEMTHILQGHTVLYKKFGSTGIVRAGQRPTVNDIMLMEFQKKHHDIHESECHATAIITAQLTDTPFDLRREIDHLAGYTQGREIPDEVMARAHENARKIAMAGERTSLNWRRGWVAA